MPYSFDLHKKRNAFDVLTASFAFVKLQPALLSYILIIAGPFMLITAYFNVQVSTLLNTELTGVLDYNVMMRIYMQIFSNGNFRLLLLFSTFATLLVHAIVFAYLIAYEKQEHIEFELIWSFIWQNMLKLAISYLLMTVVLFSGFILFIAPGVWLMVPLQLYLFIRLREEQPLLDGINRSIALNKNFWGESFLILISIYLMVSFVETIIGFPLKFMKMDSEFYLVYNYFLALVHSIIQFFLPLAFTIQYYNLKSKKEESTDGV
jgi:hypothetical protein